MQGLFSLVFQNKNHKPEVHMHAHTMHACMHTHNMGACVVLNLGMEILYKKWRYPTFQTTVNTLEAQDSVPPDFAAWKEIHFGGKPRFCPSKCPTWKNKYVPTQAASSPPTPTIPSTDLRSVCKLLLLLLVLCGWHVDEVTQLLRLLHLLHQVTLPRGLAGQMYTSILCHASVP